MKTVNLKQKSQEWLAWRRSKIMASDAPIIMGVSPYKSPEKLLEEKIQCYERPGNQWMQRGIDLEPKALSEFEKEKNLIMFPCVGIHDNGWMAASFDGMTLEEDCIVEIKCPGKKDHAMALEGKIPDKYYPQIQHQIYVSGLNMAYYFSFDGERGVTIEVNKDEIYIENMIAKLFDFWQLLQPQMVKEEPIYACSTDVF